MPKRVKDNRKKKGLFNHGLVMLVAAAVITGCAALTITTLRDCTQKEKEMVLIQAKIDSFTEENAELKRVLDSDDLSSYMEKIALEERGYAYPDERRFYDTSRD